MFAHHLVAPARSARSTTKSRIPRLTWILAEKIGRSPCYHMHPRGPSMPRGMRCEQQKLLRPWSLAGTYSQRYSVGRTTKEEDLHQLLHRAFYFRPELGRLPEGKAAAAIEELAAGCWKTTTDDRSSMTSFITTGSFCGLLSLSRTQGHGAVHRASWQLSWPWFSSWFWLAGDHSW